MRLILSSFLLFNIIILNSQSCYINLGNYSGGAVEDPSFFEATACELRAAFPDELQADVAVYDFGFYTETEPMAGSSGYESFLTTAKASITHEYFLLFARVNTPSGLNQRIIVEFVFPFGTQKFSCLIEDDIKNFRAYLPAYTNSSIGNSVQSVSLAIKNTIVKYKEFILEKKECCLPGLRNTCNSCMTASQYATTAKINGFEMKGVGLINGDEVEINTVKISISAKFQKIKTELEKIIKPIQIEIINIDELACGDNKELSEIEVDGVFGKLVVSLIKDPEKGNQIGIKFIPGKLPSNGKKINLLFFDGIYGFQPNPNIYEIVETLENYLTLIGISCPVVHYSSPEDILGYSKNDIFIAIGSDRSTMFETLKNEFLGIRAPETFEKIEWWVRNKHSLERAILPDLGLVDRLSTGQLQDVFHISAEKCMAFLILHTIGHLAGCEHGDPEYTGPTGCIDKYGAAGFMACGPSFVAAMKGPKFNSNWRYKNGSYLFEGFETVEELILGFPPKKEHEPYFFDYFNTSFVKEKITSFLK